MSALESHFQSACLKNLRDYGFPIERVIATPSKTAIGINPKAKVLQKLRSVAFFDDFLPYLRDIPAEIHAALALREPNGSPNVGEDLALTHSQHADPLGFAAS